MGNCPWEDAGRTQTEFRAYAALILEAAYAVDAPASVARPEALTEILLDVREFLMRPSQSAPDGTWHAYPDRTLKALRERLEDIL
jgi:hypothetical protein